MKLFTCSHCGQLLHFENTKCEQCGKPLGFEPGDLQLYPLQELEDGSFRLHQHPSRQLYRYCANNAYNVCNWLVPADADTNFCRACSLNRTIPDLSKPEYMERWRKIETAKHRLIYSLIRMQLPLESKFIDPDKGLFFDFVANEKTGNRQTVFTGHDNGLITINIVEADDIEREMARMKMDEVYRTLLGHFRHEIGHYYWDLLVKDSTNLEGYRKLFGDEQQDYAAALQAHYAQGPPAGWEQQYISAYATAHPWEDWAESWAHYMHILDTLETAYAFGLSLELGLNTLEPGEPIEIDRDPYEIKKFKQIMRQWYPLSVAMNSLNRSMGLPDSYPFVITGSIGEKLEFIHKLCFASRKKVPAA